MTQSKFYCQQRNADEEVLKFIERCNGFSDADLHKSVAGFVFEEFSLDELQLPDYKSLLLSVIDLEKTIGLQGWRTQDQESKTYKGFSLTYNPEFSDKTQSIFHQTWGSFLLTQYLSRKIDQGNHTKVRDSYYDSYAFRKFHPFILNNLSNLLNKFKPAIVRSRIAFNYGFSQGFKKNDNWHIDEFPFQVLRCIIPLQTSVEHVIDIVGSDEYGNSVEIFDKHLECGKIYFWNSRIPHRVTLSKVCLEHAPRIHIVLGMSPWFEYDDSGDFFYKSSLWGIPIQEIIKSKLFLR